MLQRTELQRYRAVEDERQKWEMRESRWCDKITGVEEAAGVGRDKVLEMERQLEVAMNKLHSTEAVLSGLSEKNELLQRENLALIERGRELESSLQRARLPRAEEVVDGRDRLVGLGLPGASLTSGTPLLGTALEPTLTTTPVPTRPYVGPSHQTMAPITSTTVASCATGGHCNRPGWPVEQRDTLRWSAGPVETYAILFGH